LTSDDIFQKVNTQNVKDQCMTHFCIKHDIFCVFFLCNVVWKWNHATLTNEQLGELTLWELAYDIFVLRFRPKNSSFRSPYQHPSSSADCTRELFEASNGSASLVDCTRKKFFGWGVRIFCDWRHKWSSFGVILAHVTWPRAQPLGQSVSLKFSLETRLESKSFELLIDFLAFLVQKLSSKINKLIN